MEDSQPDWHSAGQRPACQRERAGCWCVASSLARWMLAGIVPVERRGPRAFAWLV